MAIQDDIDKTIAHASTLGFSLDIEKQFRDNLSEAEVCFWDKQITLWKTSRTPKKSIVASALHELGHVHSYLEDPKEFDRYFAVCAQDKPIRRERWEVYNRERLDIARMLYIADRLDLGISRDYLRANRDFDTWQYWFWWKTGRWARSVEKRKMREHYAQQYGVYFAQRG